MLKVGIIEPADSEWTSPPVLVRKKDGRVRWCIDYRKLNNATKKDTYPLPLIEECLDALSGNMYFSTLDMASGYWQIEVEPEDRPKTAFIKTAKLGMCFRKKAMKKDFVVTHCSSILNLATAYLHLDAKLGMCFRKKAMKIVLGRRAPQWLAFGLL